MFGQLPLIYLKKIKASKELKFIDKKVDVFNVCSFMSRVYIIGCWFYDYKIYICYKYDNLINNWCKTENMNF